MSRTLQEQVAAIDAAIEAFRRYQLPPRGQAEAIAELLGVQRDHLAGEIARHNQNAENRYRTRQRERARVRLNGGAE